jgi:hypothetical protein
MRLFSLWIASRFPFAPARPPAKLPHYARPHAPR